MFDGEEFHSEEDQREDSGSTREIPTGESALRDHSVSVRREDSAIVCPHGEGAGEVIEMEVINRCGSSADCNGSHEQQPLPPSMPSSLLNQSQTMENNPDQVYCNARYVT